MTDSKHDKDASKWLEKFNEVVSMCQTELKKTTVIGKKMLSASISNTSLKEAYEEMGRLLFEALEDNSHSWENEEVSALVTKIKDLKEEMEKLESEVNDIKSQD